MTRERRSRGDDSRGEDIGLSVDAALEDDIEDSKTISKTIIPTDPAAPISNHDSEEDLHLAKKRVTPVVIPPTEKRRGPSSW
jgi:hypothetical protein